MLTELDASGKGIIYVVSYFNVYSVEAVGTALPPAQDISSMYCV